MGRSGRDTLLVIPTYNEAGNIERLLEAIMRQGLDLEILVIDDHSPDGTGDMLERLASRMPLSVIHRPAKLGLGSAYLAGFQHAIEHGYTRVVTMDADLTHNPDYLRDLLEEADRAEVVIGSRYVPGGRMRVWNFPRRVISHVAHWLTGHLLGLPHDATTAFRVYAVSALKRVDRSRLRSSGYAFLFEILHHLRQLGCSIREVPVVVDARHTGVSKISLAELIASVRTLLRLWWESQRASAAPARGTPPEMDWEQYWSNAQRKQPGVYDRIAEFYRRQIISRAAAVMMAPHLPDAPERHYLHAGCGSGGSDLRLPLRRAQVHALDLSAIALQLNRARRLPFPSWHICGDLFRLPYQAGTMDGVFNFGVMEHFDGRDIETILAEFHRVLKPGGRLILFWPPEFGLSVMGLKAFVGFMNAFRKVPLKLQPDEISRIRSFPWIRSLMTRNRFRVLETRFGWRDLFTFVVVVAQSMEAEGSPITRFGLPEAARQAEDSVSAGLRPTSG